MYIIKEYMISG